MEIPLIVRDHQFSGETVYAWKRVWKAICDMCYHGANIQEEMITTPGYFQVDEELMLSKCEKEQTQFYGQRYAINDEQLTLDHTWKEYSLNAGLGFNPLVVPEFKRLHVPAHLFYTLGVDSWFKHSFPNCTVTFWEN